MFSSLRVTSFCRISSGKVANWKSQESLPFAKTKTKKLKLRLLFYIKLNLVSSLILPFILFISYFPLRRCLTKKVKYWSMPVYAGVSLVKIDLKAVGQIFVLNAVTVRSISLKLYASQYLVTRSQTPVS